jgi:hypothetical protein
MPLAKPTPLVCYAFLSRDGWMGRAQQAIRVPISEVAPPLRVHSVEAFTNVTIQYIRRLLINRRVASIASWALLPLLQRSYGAPNTFESYCGKGYANFMMSRSRIVGPSRRVVIPGPLRIRSDFPSISRLTNVSTNRGPFHRLQLSFSRASSNASK